MERLKSILAYESGQGLIEFSLIITLVTIAVIGAMILFVASVYDLYEIVKEKVTNAL